MESLTQKLVCAIASVTVVGSMVAVSPAQAQLAPVGKRLAATTPGSVFGGKDATRSSRTIWLKPGTSAVTVTQAEAATSWLPASATAKG